MQKLSEYNKWLEELCYATPVASAEYNSLTSHAAFLARLLAQQNKSAMPTIQSAVSIINIPYLALDPLIKSSLHFEKIIGSKLQPLLLCWNVTLFEAAKQIKAF